MAMWQLEDTIWSKTQPLVLMQKSGFTRLSQGGLSIIKDLVFSMAEGDLLQIYLQFLSASFISDNIM